MADLVVSTEQPGWRRGEVVSIDRHGAHRRKLRLQSGAAEAMQLDRLVEVAQPVSTDRGELDVSGLARFRGDDLGGEYLTAVRRGGHPGCLVDSEGDVVAVAW